MGMVGEGEMERKGGRRGVTSEGECGDGNGELENREVKALPKYDVFNMLSQVCHDVLI